MSAVGVLTSPAAASTPSVYITPLPYNTINSPQLIHIHSSSSIASSTPSPKASVRHSPRLSSPVLSPCVSLVPKHDYIAAPPSIALSTPNTFKLSKLVLKSPDTNEFICSPFHNLQCGSPSPCSSSPHSSSPPGVWPTHLSSPSNAFMSRLPVPHASRPNPLLSPIPIKSCLKRSRSDSPPPPLQMEVVQESSSVPLSPPAPLPLHTASHTQHAHSSPVSPPASPPIVKHVRVTSIVSMRCN